MSPRLGGIEGKLRDPLCAPVACVLETAASKTVGTASV